MNCSCTGNTNSCGCNACRTIRLNQFAVSGQLDDNKQFVLADNTLVTYQTLLNDIQAKINTYPDIEEQHFGKIVDGVLSNSGLSENEAGTSLLFNGIPVGTVQDSIVETDQPYSAGAGDDYVAMTNGNNVTLYDSALAVKPITIHAVNIDTSVVGQVLFNDDGIVKAGYAKKYIPVTGGYAAVSDLSYTDDKADKLDNVYEINSKSDFPAPSGGVIELGRGVNSTYIIKAGTIDLGTDTAAITDGTTVSIIGAHGQASQITTNSLNPLINIVNSSLDHERLIMSNSSGDVYAFSGDGTNFLLGTRIIYFNCDNIVQNVSGSTSFALFRSTIISTIVGGISFSS